MPSFSGSLYTFDKSNTNYINAIAKYNRKVSIAKINGRPSSYYIDKLNDKSVTASAANLAKILTVVGGDELTIETSYGNSVSTVGAFPVLQKDRLLSAIPEVMTEHDQILTGKIFTEINEYFKQIKARGFFEVYIATPGKVDSLTQSQALFLLDNIQQELEVTGAMHFPELEVILLQINNDNFLLRYGKESSFDEMPRLCFDLDDGFVPGWSRYDEVPELPKKIVDQLQNYFQAWKNNNYSGELIPANLSGFKYGQQAVISHQASPARASQSVKTSEALVHELDQQEAFLAQAQALSASPLANLNFLASASKPAAAQPAVVEEVKIKPGQ